MTKDSLPISTGSFSDLSLFASRHEARCFLDGMPRVPWKSASGSSLSVPERERAEHGAKSMRSDTPWVQANFVYDLREVRLPPVKHG